MRADSQEFKGWAIIEMMGHQQASGFVETVAFGGAVMFHVFADEVASTEQIAENRTYFGGRSIPAGAKYRTSRPRFEKFIGISSVYALTPCTQEEATRSLPVTLELIELPALAAPGGDPDKEPVAALDMPLTCDGVEASRERDNDEYEYSMDDDDGD